METDPQKKVFPHPQKGPEDTLCLLGRGELSAGGVAT